MRPNWQSWMICAKPLRGSTRIMFNNSVLLAIDGSLESICAAKAAWRLAEKTKDGSVTAQYVLDGPAVWKFLGFDRRGFIGSGPYVAGYLNVCNSMRLVGDALLT